MFTINTEDAVKLAAWYDDNKRELPWRDTGDAYDVWLSEIMLQQTRIEAVRPKFLLFKQELPNIEAVATCHEDKLMRIWEGLGYYSRARNLQKCAKVLCERYDGQLPKDYEALLKLPGIGPYTAGAIASIAFGIPVPAVDGNVLRVLARLQADYRDVKNPSVRKEATQEVRTLFMQNSDPHFVSSFNQGIMELGETVCIPNGTPSCEICPLHVSCRAHATGMVDDLPYRSAPKERKTIERTLFIIRDGSKFLLHKRKKTGLLAGLYEFIGVDEKISKQEAIARCQTNGIDVLRIRTLPTAKHMFTHLTWDMSAYEIMTGQLAEPDDPNYVLTSKKELAHLAVPSAFKTYIDFYALRDHS